SAAPRRSFVSASSLSRSRSSASVRPTKVGLRRKLSAKRSVSAASSASSSARKFNREITSAALGGRARGSKLSSESTSSSRPGGTSPTNELGATGGDFHRLRRSSNVSAGNACRPVSTQYATAPTE